MLNFRNASQSIVNIKKKMTEIVIMTFKLHGWNNRIMCKYVFKKNNCSVKFFSASYIILKKLNYEEIQFYPFVMLVYLYTSNKKNYILLSFGLILQNVLTTSMVWSVALPVVNVWTVISVITWTEVVRTDVTQEYLVINAIKVILLDLNLLVCYWL